MNHICILQQEFFVKPLISMAYSKSLQRYNFLSKPQPLRVVMRQPSFFGAKGPFFTPSVEYTRNLTADIYVEIGESNIPSASMLESLTDFMITNSQLKFIINLIGYPDNHFGLSKIRNAKNIDVIENRINYFPEDVKGMISNAGHDKAVKALTFKVPLIAFVTDVSEITFCRSL